MTKLSLKEKLIYSMGNLGIAIITVMHMLFLVYFYFPPENAGLPYLVPQNSFFVGLTILGLILAFTRITDAILDPVIASFSDRLKHPLGKRVPLLRWAAVPFSLSYLLVFFAPHTDGVSITNIIWLFLSLIISTFCFTSYMIPFYSLLALMAKSSDDKVDLGTISSAFWFVGFLIVSFTSGLWKPLQKMFEITPLWSIRLTFSFTALLGLICLLIPAFLIDEKQYGEPDLIENREKLLPALKDVLRHKNFRWYLLGNAGYTIATYIFEGGLIYFITVLALLDASIQGPLTTIIGALTLLCYPLVNIISKKKGRKVMLSISLVLFAMTFGCITLLGVANIHVYILLGLVVLLAPLSQAGFGILPHVITADNAAYDLHKTGKDKTGMYVAANGFVGKMGSSIAMIIFTSLLVLGKDVGNDGGIRLATLIAVITTLSGLIAILKYDEKEVMSHLLDKKHDT